MPNLSEEETRRLDYSLLDYDRTHNFTINAIYQTPSVTSSRGLGLLANDWQLSGVYRWTSGRPDLISYSIPGIGAANLTGTDGNPNARVALTCDPGKGYSGDPYRQFTNPACFAPPQPGSKGDETPRFFARNPPLNNLDLSVSKNFPIARGMKFEFRLDIFNLLDTVQFTEVNNTVNFASLTDRTITNLPYDAQGNLVQRNGFGTVRARRASAHAAARHSPHVLGALAEKCGSRSEAQDGAPPALPTRPAHPAPLPSPFSRWRRRRREAACARIVSRSHGGAQIETIVRLIR